MKEKIVSFSGFLRHSLKEHPHNQHLTTIIKNPHLIMWSPEAEDAALTLVLIRLPLVVKSESGSSISLPYDRPSKKFPWGEYMRVSVRRGTWQGGKETMCLQLLIILCCIWAAHRSSRSAGAKSVMSTTYRLRGNEETVRFVTEYESLTYRVKILDASAGSKSVLVLFRVRFVHASFLWPVDLVMA